MEEEVLLEEDTLIPDLIVGTEIEIEDIEEDTLVLVPVLEAAAYPIEIEGNYFLTIKGKHNIN